MPVRRLGCRPVGRRYYGDGHPAHVFLGFGKHVRADRIYALEPIVGDERGNGRRTLVWVEGMVDPMIASRTQETILDEMGAASASLEAQRSRTQRREHPQLFSDDA
jgi:hypothetical protein